MNVDQKDKWAKSERWKRHGKNFTVEVVHWTSPRPEWDQYRGENCWNVYAYIFPKHPMFKAFNETDDIFQDAASSLHLHAGASWCKSKCDRSGAVYCIEVGSDYSHHGDDHFGHMETREDAYEVFRDAVELFEQLEGRQEFADQQEATGASHE